MQDSNDGCMRHSKAKTVTDTISVRFKEIRVEQGLSHQALADKSGLNRSTISRIESRDREPTLINCIKIADALGVSIKDLL